MTADILCSAAAARRTLATHFSPNDSTEEWRGLRQSAVVCQENQIKQRFVISV